MEIMPKSEELNREKYRFIIYHGHIHILAKNEDYEDQDNLNDKKFLNSNLFLYKRYYEKFPEKPQDFNKWVEQVEKYRGLLKR